MTARPRPCRAPAPILEDLMSQAALMPEGSRYRVLGEHIAYLDERLAEANPGSDVARAADSVYHSALRLLRIIGSPMRIGASE